MEVSEVLDLDDAEDVVDAAGLEVLGGQRRRQRRDQHVVLDEGVEDVLGHELVALPLEGVWGEVLVDEGAAGALPFLELGRVVGRGQAIEVGRLGEGDVGGGHGGMGRRWLWLREEVWSGEDGKGGRATYGLREGPDCI